MMIKMNKQKRPNLVECSYIELNYVNPETTFHAVHTLKTIKVFINKVWANTLTMIYTLSIHSELRNVWTVGEMLLKECQIKA